MKTHLLLLVACLCLVVAGCKKDVDQLTTANQENSGRTVADNPGFNMLCSNDPFPDASWVPYSSQFAFNIPVSAESKTDPNSQAIIAWILSNGQHPSNVVFRKDGLTGEPTFWARTNDPEYTMECLFCPYWESLSFDKSTIRIPFGAMVEKDEAAMPKDVNDYLNQPDAHITIIDPTGMEYDFWGGRRGVPVDPPGKGIRPRKLDDVFSFSFAGRLAITGDGLSQEGKANAAALGGLAGRIRAEELLAGRINHAIALVVAGVSPVPRALTRGHNALVSPNPNAPALGSRIHLNMSLTEIDHLAATYGIPNWQVIILKCLSEYGGFVTDTGTQDFFALEFESGSQYTSVGLADRYLEFAKNNGFTHKAQGEQSDYLPSHYVGWWGVADGKLDYKTHIWSRLRVLAE
jgi:hypothetical protein